jgi:hypothetical protein
MKNRASRRFWDCYRALPEEVQRLADANYALLKSNPRHPGLQLKKAGRFWFVRIGLHYRAVAVEEGAEPENGMGLVSISEAIAARLRRVLAMPCETGLRRP